MKLLKLTTACAALLGSTFAVAAPQTQAYQYDGNRGIIKNTTGAFVNTTKTLFDTAIHPGSVNAEIGTLGYGASLSWSVNDSTEIQAGWNGASFDDSQYTADSKDLIDARRLLGDGYGAFEGDLAYDVDMSNPYIGVQMRPMNNWVTVGAGVLVANNDVDARLTSLAPGGDEIVFGANRYNLPQGTTVLYEIENGNDLAPYATIGFRPNISDKWGAFAEVGVAYMGKMDANVKVLDTNAFTGGNLATGITGQSIVPSSTRQGEFVAVDMSNAQAKQNFEADALKEINDEELWYPIAKAGLTYRF